MVHSKEKVIEQLALQQEAETIQTLAYNSYLLALQYTENEPLEVLDIIDLGVSIGYIMCLEAEE